METGLIIALVFGILSLASIITSTYFIVDKTNNGIKVDTLLWINLGVGILFGIISMGSLFWVKRVGKISIVSAYFTLTALGLIIVGGVSLYKNPKKTASIATLATGCGLLIVSSIIIALGITVGVTWAKPKPPKMGADLPEEPTSDETLESAGYRYRTLGNKRTEYRRFDYRSNGPTVISLIEVNGFGCETIDDFFYLRKANNYAKAYPDIDKVTVYCNRRKVKALGDIVGSLTTPICDLPPKLNDEFVTAVFNQVINDVKNPEQTKVIILGHSYGGSVVGRVAERLNYAGLSKEELEKIVIRTTGTIYIPDRDNVNNVDIQHIIYRQDFQSNACRQDIKKKDVEGYISYEDFVPKGGQTDSDAHGSYDRFKIIDNILGLSSPEVEEDDILNNPLWTNYFE